MAKSVEDKFKFAMGSIAPIPLPQYCICLSDVHMGAGDDHDPCKGSGAEPALIAVLQEYYGKGYSLLKNGDWWDVWRGYDVDKIYEAHPKVLDLVNSYKAANRLYEILGNHERDPFDSVYVSIIIFNGFGKKIFMDHGWIGDVFNDELWLESRDLLRAADKLGMESVTSPHPENAERYLALRRIRRQLADNHPDWDFLWGHTHYFDNTGNDHNSGSLLVGYVEGYLIEEGNISRLEKR